MSEARRGMVLVYVIVMMTMLCGFVSLGVDFGRVQLAKTQLERAAFAAARAGAAGIGDGTATSKAIQFAAANLVDGSPLVLKTADVVVGTWSGGAFTPGGATPNAIQINAYRNAARGTAVPLAFGQLIGQASCDIKCVGIVATASGGNATGFTGLNSFTVGGSFFSASYNSGVTVNPSHGTYNSHGLMQTNGVLGQGASSGHHYGSAKVGPSGRVAGGLSVSGTTATLGSSISAPAVTMQIVTNPGGVSLTPNVNGNVTWQAGTYYFTSLTLQDNATIGFLGPAVIYLDGNCLFHNDNKLTAYHSLPANLMIYQSSGHTFNGSDHAVVVAVYNGPGSTVSFHDDAAIQGSMMAKSIALAGTGSLYYDESLGTGSQTIGLGH